MATDIFKGIYQCLCLSDLASFPHRLHFSLLFFLIEIIPSKAMHVDWEVIALCMLRDGDKKGKEYLKEERRK